MFLFVRKFLRILEFEQDKFFKGGNIINISSGASKSLMAGVSLYSATKAAWNAITISLSKELGPKDVRINSVLQSIAEREGATSVGVTPDSEYEKCLSPTPRSVA